MRKKKNRAPFSGSSKLENLHKPRSYLVHTSIRAMAVRIYSDAYIRDSCLV